ncbi:MAG: replication factor C small subunit [Nitrososphaeraceae archaeon]
MIRTFYMPQVQAKNLSNLMWVEKYRPFKLDDIVNQKEIIESLKNLMKESAEMPHLLFTGPAGVGKTTTALCMSRQLLGEDWKRDTLELNASDERGIKMVRERVKEFAAVIKIRTTERDERKFRIIILDEADEMTSEAQTALRRIIEDSSETTRFVIICNYLSQIIEPIQSRCAIFRFKRIEKETVEDHLKWLCKKEGIKYDDRAISQIFDSTNGDLRHSINILQSASVMGSISVSNVLASLGLTGKSKVNDIIKLAMSGKFNDARIKLLELTAVYGMSEFDFLKYAYEAVYSLKLAHPEDFASLIAEYDYRLTHGSHPDIQLTAFLAQLSRIGSKSD